MLRSSFWHTTQSEEGGAHGVCSKGWKFADPITVPRDQTGAFEIVTGRDTVLQKTNWKGSRSRSAPSSPHGTIPWEYCPVLLPTGQCDPTPSRMERSGIFTWPKKTVQGIPSYIVPVMNMVSIDSTHHSCVNKCSAIVYASHLWHSRRG